MMYSVSHLCKGTRCLKVVSTYVHHNQFPSYVVRVYLLRGRKAHYARDRATFSKIHNAETFHAEQVLHFVGKGYDITSSTCK